MTLSTENDKKQITNVIKYKSNKKRGDVMNRRLLALLIKINRDKLNKMVEEEEDYEKILKQSQKLDKYIYLNLKNQVEDEKQKLETT